MRPTLLRVVLGLSLPASAAWAQPSPETPPAIPAPAPALQPAAATPQPDASPAAQPTPTPAPTPAPKPASPMVLGHTMTLLDGTTQDLAAFKGKVVLIVNTASRCGYTPQYAGLEALYKAKKEQGLVVLGFPSNDFGKQEPGDAAQIRAFCDENYGVTFPLFAKVKVTGPEACPLYQQLAAQAAPIGGEPKWNFTKFLVNREGNVVARFDTRTRPDDPALVRAVDDLLASALPPTPPAESTPQGKGPDQR